MAARRRCQRCRCCVSVHSRQSGFLPALSVQRRTVQTIAERRPKFKRESRITMASFSKERRLAKSSAEGTALSARGGHPMVDPRQLFTSNEGFLPFRRRMPSVNASSAPDAPPVGRSRTKVSRPVSGRMVTSRSRSPSGTFREPSTRMTGRSSPAIRRAIAIAESPGEPAMLQYAFDGSTPSYPPPIRSCYLGNRRQRQAVAHSRDSGNQDRPS